MAILIADSGATKCEWRLLGNGRKKSVFTQGMSPYFLSTEQMAALIESELLPKLGRARPSEVHFFGTGNKDPRNARKTQSALKSVFPGCAVNVDHDLMGACRALSGNERGVVCILGTGSNSCYYNGKRIVKNSPGIGYVLGDEGSGAYLGKKLIQYFLYETFDKELSEKFLQKYPVTPADILENVYRKPLPNRYLASFTTFLSENRGHYMIENIIEDGLFDFFSKHLTRYPESTKYPVHFTGGVAHHFRDMVEELCSEFGFTLGTVLKNPMDGLARFYGGK